MARYKPIHQGVKLLAVDFDRQILPGTFEHALRHLVDHELDLEGFQQRYKNDVQGVQLLTQQLCWKSSCWLTAVALSVAVKWKRRAARICCSLRFPVTASRISPRWRRSSPMSGSWSPNCCPSAADLWPPRLNRQRAICHRRGEVAVQCQQRKSRAHTRWLPAPSRTHGKSCRKDDRQTPTCRCQPYGWG